MAKMNPFEQNMTVALRPHFVNLDYIEDIAVEETDPLAILLDCEEKLERGEEAVLEAWHISCS